MSLASIALVVANANDVLLSNKKHLISQQACVVDSRNNAADGEQGDKSVVVALPNGSGTTSSLRAKINKTDRGVRGKPTSGGF
jgi:hypothetical protein